MKRAFKRLARDLEEFFEEYGGEVEWSVEDDYDCLR